MDINIGDIFGRWTVMDNIVTVDKFNHKQILCKCGCEKQTERYVSMHSLKNKKSTSCGCIASESLKKSAFKHGLSDTVLYNKWRAMLSRCYNENNKFYYNYGARGIRVCEEWKEFINFYNDLILSYQEHVKTNGEEDTTLDRIDNNKDYSKDNCKWATYKQQGNNRRSNHIIIFQGDRYTAQEIAEKYDIPHDSFRTRLKRGWTIEEALEIKEKIDKRCVTITIDGEVLYLKKYAESLGFNGDTAVSYVSRHNLTPQEAIDKLLKNKKE